MLKRNRLILCIVISILALTVGCSQLTADQKSFPTNTTLSDQSSNPKSDSPLETNSTPTTANPTNTANKVTSDVKAVSKDVVANKEVSTNKEVSVPALSYHSISSVHNSETSMPPSEFERQMAYLSKQGYHTVSVTQLSDFLLGKGSLPSKPIAITFDDGFKDNLTNALPIMKKYGFTATIFVIANHVGSKDRLSWDDLKILIKDGWEIGDHSMTHVDLTKLDSKNLTKEVKGSKELLEKNLGSIKSFSYPSGRYDPTVEKAVKNAGYLIGFTTNKGWVNIKTDMLLQPRVYCYSSMGLAEFEKRVKNPGY